MNRSLAVLFLVPCLVLAAEDSRPYLGLNIDRPAEFDQKPGVVVLKVIPGTTAEKLGLAPGDRVVRVGDRPITTTEDFALATASWRVGQTVGLTILRQDATTELSGPVVDAVRPKDLGLQAQALARQMSELEAKTAPPNQRLEELLTLLNKVNHDLPAMSAEFRKTYPKGRFNISIHIDIASDPEDPATTPIQPAPTTGTTPTDAGTAPATGK